MRILYCRGYEESTWTFMTVYPGYEEGEPWAYQDDPDVFLVSVNEYNLDQDLVDKIIQLHGRPDAILNPFYCRIDLDTSVPVYTATNFWYHAAVLLLGATAPTQQITTQCFNFMLNRKRINRYLTARLVSYFELLPYSEYTWSGADRNYDLSIIIDEMNRLDLPWVDPVRQHVLPSIEIEPRWFGTKGKLTSSGIATSLPANPYYQDWNQGLDEMFSTSAVSIITESIDYQAGAAFTEKTAYAILGRTIPIWVGGKYQAEEFAKLGFDTFNDVVDHSYQYCDTLVERCYRAFADNLHLLNNLTHATYVRQQMHNRLLKNQQHLIDSCSSIENIIAESQKGIANFDPKVQKLMLTLIQKGAKRTRRWRL